MKLSRLSVPQRVSAVAMLVVIIAAFLPWGSPSGTPMVGVDGGGAMTLVLAAVGVAILALTTGVVGRPKRPGLGSHIALAALAGIAALMGLIAMHSAAAIGLYLTLAGGIAWVVGAVW